MPAPDYPRYVSPKERAENRARIRAFGYPVPALIRAIAT